MQIFPQPFARGRVAVALLLIRVVFGIGIATHGLQKCLDGGPFHWADSAPILQDIPPPLQGLATLSEFGGGLAMIFGLLTPLAMLGLTITMGVGLVKFHLAQGRPYVSIQHPGQDFEPLGHYLIVAFGLLFSGPGALSLDYLFFGRRRAITGSAPAP